MTVSVLKPGAYSSFQDLGRTGAQHLGFPVSGAMDTWSHRIANRVLGNADYVATLEITLTGPTLRFDCDALIAWCGADLSPLIVGNDPNASTEANEVSDRSEVPDVPDATDAPAASGSPVASGPSATARLRLTGSDRAVPAATPVLMRAGETLRFGKRQAGLRVYLAVRGGFSLTPFLASCSTWARAGLGGHRGRPLVRGDVFGLSLAPAPAAAAAAVAAHPVTRPDSYDERSRAARSLADIDNARFGAPIRVLRGREYALFDAASQRALIEQPYRIGAQSDRMGLRLAGRALERAVQGELLSEAVGFGTMQVPPDGQPIVLMAERQTTGGYPKIAQVASVDLSRLAQYAPGEVLRFEWIGLADAQALLLARLRELDRLLPTANDSGASG